MAELLTHDDAEILTRDDHDLATTPFLVGWSALWSAIALNVSQVFVLDSTDGLREPALLPLVAAGFLAELWLFGRAVRCLTPVIAYAAYGTTPAVVTILSAALFDEALTVSKLAGVSAVTAGVLLLATDRTPAPRARCAEHVAPPRTDEPSVDPSEPRPTLAHREPARRFTTPTATDQPSRKDTP